MTTCLIDLLGKSEGYIRTDERDKDCRRIKTKLLELQFLQNLCGMRRGHFIYTMMQKEPLWGILWNRRMRTELLCPWLMVNENFQTRNDIILSQRRRFGGGGTV